MAADFIAGLRPMRIGVVLSMLTLGYGFGLGGLFGAAEDKIKGHLKAQARQVRDTAYQDDPAKMKKVTDKSWQYFKRAHMHANGLGAVSLAVILVLAPLGSPRRLKSIAGLSLGLGSLGYSLFWMFAGLRAPGLGSTGAAKESLGWLAQPTAGLCIIGLVLAAVLALAFLFHRAERGK